MRFFAPNMFFGTSFSKLVGTVFRPEKFFLEQSKIRMFLYNSIRLASSNRCTNVINVINVVLISTVDFIFVVTGATLFSTVPFVGTNTIQISAVIRLTIPSHFSLQSLSNTRFKIDFSLNVTYRPIISLLLSMSQSRYELFDAWSHQTLSVS